MKTLNFKINDQDLKTLFLYTRNVYGKITFTDWVKEAKSAYSSFAKGKDDVITFSKWVNGQIISLT